MILAFYKYMVYSCPMDTRDEAVKGIRSFNRFYTNIIGVVDHHILDSQYSLTEVRVLYEIYHDPGITARNIKDFLLVDEGYLSHLLDKLTKNGLIQRSRSKEDRRVYHLALTQKGEDEFLEMSSRSDRAIESLIRNLPESDLQKLVSLMCEIKTILNAKEESDD